MAKLNRLTAKIFGETASTVNTPKEIGQFGSAKAGTYNATGDVATIQSLPAWSNGWIDAVTPTDQFPPLPEMTGVHKVLSYQNAYLLQQGIPEWDSATDYHENGFCSYGGTIYKSLADNNLNNQPDNSPTYWETYGAISDYANQDLSNLSATGNTKIVPDQTSNSGKFLATKNNVSGWYNVFSAISPDLANGVSKSTSGFTADADGWLTAYLSGNSAIFVNGVTVMEQSANKTRQWAFLFSGDVVTYYATKPDNMTFYPLKGI